MRVFLIRHGRTAWNAQGLFQGGRDIPLDATGRDQVKAMAEKAAGIPFAVIWSSPLARARETADALARKTGVEVCEHGGLSEIRHGKWEGLKAEVVARRWPRLFSLWHERPEEVVMPEGESLEDVQARSMRAMEDVTARERDPIAVVTHDAVIKVLLCTWLGLPLSRFRCFELGNASITGVRLSKKRASLFLLGDTSWSETPYSRELQVSL
ncbi:MAG: histidine phosphatase family protein [Thermovirgaceae bacterium]